MVFNDACLKLPDATLRSTWFFWSISAWKENYSFVKLVLVPAVALWIFSRPIIYHNLSSHHLFRNHITKRAYTNSINIVIIRISPDPHHQVCTPYKQVAYSTSALAAEAIKGVYRYPVVSLYVSVSNAIFEAPGVWYLAIRHTHMAISYLKNPLWEFHHMYAYYT